MFDLLLDPFDGDDLLSATFTAGFLLLLLLLAAAAAVTAAAAAAAASFLFFFDCFLLVFPFVVAGLSFGLLFVVVVVDVFGFDVGVNDLLLLAALDDDDFDSFAVGFCCSFEDDSTVVVVVVALFTVSFSFTLTCSYLLDDFNHLKYKIKCIT